MDCLQYFLKYFSQLFLIICPLAIIAMYISMTGPFSHKERIRTARVGSAVAYGVMLFFALTGKKIFEILGITMGSFYIGGGIIIFLVGISMLNSDDVEASSIEGEEAKKKHVDISITPFGIPIICGPVCITTTIALQSQAAGFCQFIAGLLALTCVVGVLYLLLVFSAQGAKWLNPTILKLSYKLSGLILAALAVQMIISGLRHEDIGVLKPLPTLAVIQEIAA